MSHRDKISNDNNEDFVKKQRAALAKLILESYDKLLATAQNILPEKPDAEDAVQEALFKAYKSLDKFRGDSSLYTWVCSILRNQAYSKYRHCHRKNTVSTESQSASYAAEIAYASEAADWKSIPEQRLINNETTQHVLNGIKQLSSDMQQTAYLYFFENMPQNAIALKLNCPPGTIRSRISRIKKFLTDYLQQNE